MGGNLSLDTVFQEEQSVYCTLSYSSRRRLRSIVDMNDQFSREDAKANKTRAACENVKDIYFRILRLCVRKYYIPRGRAEKFRRKELLDISTVESSARASSSLFLFLDRISLTTLHLQRFTKI